MAHSTSRTQPRDIRAWQRGARRIAAVTSALVLIASMGTGCATTASKQKAEKRRRQATAHFNLGVDHLENGRTALGLRELLIAESFDSNDPYIQYGLSRAYLAADRDGIAERHLLRSLDVFPEYHDARLTLSGLYFLLQRWDAAAAQSRLLVDDPTLPYPWVALTNIGWAQFKLGRTADARESFERALHFNRNYWQSQLNLGILEEQEGHRTAALKAYGVVLESRASSSAVAEANYRSAEVLVSLGKRRRAVRHLMAAVAQSPDGLWGQKSEEYLEVIR